MSHGDLRGIFWSSMAFLLALCSSARPALGQTVARWGVAAAPAWVEKIAPADTSPPNAGSKTDDGGQHFVLFDRQVRVERDRTASFSHWSRRITNEVGLQQSSQLVVDFDASYQTLTLHYVRVKRGDVQIDELDRAAIKVIQRESELDAQVYNGLKSAVLFLRDVRVGDVVDYAYTVSGSDPTLSGKFIAEFPLGASVVVDRVFERLLVPNTREAKISTHGPNPADPALQPERRAQASVTEYRWDLTNTPAYPLEKDAPKWAEQVPFVRVSEFKSWQEVATWGELLFLPETKPSSGLLTWIAEAQRNASSPANYVLRATRFVQDEIRYVGLEVGMGRRKPTDPSTVLARRFGDCKDKTALLIALLRGNGIDAQPVLVSSLGGPALDTSIPSPGVFDHVITRVLLNDTLYFIDATVALQGGPLSRLRYSPFDRRLVLNGATHELIALQREPADEPEVHVFDHLVVPTPTSSAETRLDTVRAYQGNVADAVRAQFRAQPLEQIAKSYLAFFQDGYPGIHEVSPLEHTDDRASNHFEVTGHFAIPKPWKLEENSKLYAMQISARSTDFGLARPSSTARSALLDVPFPYHCEYDIDVDLPFTLKVDTPPKSVSGPAFAMTFTANVDGRKLLYHYDVATTAAAVAATGAAHQVEMIDAARALMTRGVTYSPGVAELAAARGMNWLMLAIATAWLALCAWLSWRAYLLPKAIANTRSSRGPPAPFGGWLLVMGLNVFTTPIIILAGAVPGTKALFFRAHWLALTTPGLASYRPFLAAAVIVEVGFQVVFFCYSLTVVATWLKRRRSFPWHFSLLCLAIAAFSVVDAVVLTGMGSRKSELEAITAVARSLIFAAVWVSYVHRSQRVARTFTTRLPKKRRPKRERSDESTEVLPSLREDAVD